jgi:excisionase family DNA binding protein
MHDNELITMKAERIASFFKLLDRMLDGIENLVKNHKPTLNGERYLTDREVSTHLKVSRRTLQDYRNEGRIPYCQLGGKILYRESDIQKVLETGYREAFK